MMVYSIMMRLTSIWSHKVLKSASSGKRMIRVLRGDTYMFVLLVYWLTWADLELLCGCQWSSGIGTVLMKIVYNT